MNGNSTFTWFKLPTALITQPKFQRLSPIAQAGFVTLCCVYWQDSGVMTYDDAQMNAEGVDELIDKGYIEADEGMISIGFLDEQIEEVDKLRAKKKEAGVKSAEARAKKKASTSSTPVQHVFNGCSTDKSRLEEIYEIDEKRQIEEIEEIEESGAHTRDGGFVEFEEVGIDQPTTHPPTSKKQSGGGRREIIIPWDSQAFAELWQLWKEYKKKEHRFSYKSEISEQGSLKQLATLSGGVEATAQQIIQQSIDNGWKGFFPLKPQNNGNSSNTADIAASIANQIANGDWDITKG